jgi:hypothetical protein
MRGSHIGKMCTNRATCDIDFAGATPSNSDMQNEKRA